MDPVTVIATATAAYNFIKKGIQTGKELEGMTKQLGQWFDCLSQFRQHEQSVSNPPLFKKLLFAGSVEQEALNLLVHRKQLENQERELRELIVYSYGVEAYREMIQMRRDITLSRRKAIAKQKQRLKNILYQGVLWTLLIFLFGIAGVILWLTVRLLQG